MKKLVPTETGIKVNEFLVDHFAPILEIDFTAKLEKLLDKVASGKVKWYNVLDEYYNTFNPMVVELEKQLKHITNTHKTDVLVGIHPDTNEEIYSTIARYGLCIKMKDGDKLKYAPVNNIKQEDITLDIAVKLLEYPKNLGKIGKSEVTLNKGKYGLYLKMGNKKIGVKKEEKDIDLQYAKELFEGGDPYAIKSFKLKGKTVHLKSGPYGYYLQVVYKSKKNKRNISLPKNVNIEKITLETIQNSFNDK